MNLVDFKDKHAGQRIFLLGSGPSLAHQDLRPLANELTFTCNNGYRLQSKIGHPSTYWALEDHLDMSQFQEEFRAFTGSVKFVAHDLGEDIGEKVVVPFNRDAENTGYPAWAAAPPFEFGGTVMYLMLQLAAYMGCAPIYLLGNDFRWNMDNVEATAGRWKTTGPDDNHFDTSYWPTNAKSYPPQPARMRRAFVSANRYAKRQIVNLTPESALDVFEVGDYARVLAGTSTAPLGMEQITDEIDPFAAMIRELKPVNVLEIGVRGGGTSALWHELASGLVIGVDLDQPGTLKSRMERFPRFRAVPGNSHESSVQRDVRSLLGDKLVDLLFIDGDHSYHGAKRDHAEYRDLVRPGGIIAFHDINAGPQHFAEWEHGGVPRFWQELVDASKQEFTVKADWGGIGVIVA